MRAWVLVLLLSSTVSAQDSVGLVNTMDEPVNVWIHHEDRTVSGPFFIAKGQEEAVPLSRPGRYHVTIRDQLRRDLVVGWVDLHQLARENPSVALRGLYESKGLFLGDAIVDGVLTPKWQPLGKPYAMKCELIPFFGQAMPKVQEIVFVNRPELKVVRITTVETIVVQQ